MFPTYRWADSEKFKTDIWKVTERNIIYEFCAVQNLTCECQDNQGYCKLCKNILCPDTGLIIINDVEQISVDTLLQFFRKSIELRM